MSLACLAGFASLASEVLWTRVLRMVVQGTTQAFAAMLVNFLVGIAVGSLVAERLMAKGRDPRTLFGITQLLLGVLSVAAMAVGRRCRASRCFFKSATRSSRTSRGSCS
ncbi:MAG: hypothetical protein H6721_23725 [Sandaracinus sp.]|nr:hypothetical protein [Sandaracinus sp.]